LVERHSAPEQTTSDEHAARRLFVLSIGMFFIGGFLTAIVGLLVPRFKLLYGLSYSQASLVQLASHSSYLLFAVPITVLLIRIGYMRAIFIGLAVMAVGCLAFVAADAAHAFALVLGALLLLSLGITFLQIAANTVVTLVGSARGSASRLTLLQGFNSLGTVLGPLLAAPLLLDSLGGEGRVALPFWASALVLAGLALSFAINRNLLRREVRRAPAKMALGGLPALLRDRVMMWGTLAMFAYVGAEVTIGTLLTNYLVRPEALALSPVSAGQMVSLYWGGAMVGRFAGAVLLGRFDPGRMLAATAIGAAALTALACVVGGWLGSAALIAVGLCNAIMYPTIYALALPVDEAAAPLGSMLLCMAVVGGAVVPVLTSIAADAVGLVPALLLPALCYLGIAAFARMPGR
jgi:FHS family L-fucose permease-like MFS transporter